MRRLSRHWPGRAKGGGVLICPSPVVVTGKSTPKPGQYVQGAKEKTRRAP